MPNYVYDLVSITNAATRLAHYPGTDHQFSQLSKFAFWIESQARAHEQYFAQECWEQGQKMFQQQQAAQVTQVPPMGQALHHGAPMRPQSMSRTPPPPPSDDEASWLLQQTAQVDDLVGETRHAGAFKTQ